MAKSKLKNPKLSHLSAPVTLLTPVLSCGIKTIIAKTIPKIKSGSAIFSKNLIEI